MLARGELLTVIDPEGEQVADLFAFAADDTDERLLSGRTLDYASKLWLTTGDVLYSDRSRPMLAIVADSVRRHDFLYTPCSPDTFRILYGDRRERPSCEQNLLAAFAAFDIRLGALPTTFNIFMNVAVGDDGTLRVLPPRSAAGDRITLRAETDLVVGLTACSAELSNNYRFKPIDFEIVS